MKFQAREANSRRRSESSNPVLAELESYLLFHFLSFFIFFSSFSFLLLVFFFTIKYAHTYTNKVWGGGEGGAKRRGRAERRQRAVRFTRFVDYGLMFDSRLSFSLKYDLIRSPY